MITRGDVFKEIVAPSEAEKAGMTGNDLLMYKALYMSIRLSLDIRHNQVRMSKGEKIEQKSRPAEKVEFDHNPVIKDTDKVQVKK